MKASAARKPAKPRSKSSTDSGLRGGLESIASQITEMFSFAPKDIVAAIKVDHSGLRNFLDVLKDTDREMSERKAAYQLFSALLKSHSSSEEKAVYNVAAKRPGSEIHIKVEEGFVEHNLAALLMKKIESAKNPLQWSAHANVLAEIVKHHLDEEERDLLPKVKKVASRTGDQKMLKAYLALRKRSQKKVTTKNAGVLDR